MNQGDEETAARLRRLLLVRKIISCVLRVLALLARFRSIPRAASRLIEQIKPQAIDEPPVVLDETQWATVREFISVAKSQGQIEADGVTANVSLLVYGPPGTGKKSSRQIYCGRVGTRALRHKA